MSDPAEVKVTAVVVGDKLLVAALCGSRLVGVSVVDISEDKIRKEAA